MTRYIQFPNTIDDTPGEGAPGCTDNNLHTMLSSDAAGTPTYWEDDDQSTTRGTPTAQPSAGAIIVSIALIDIGSASADGLFVVFNATNDADADAKLAAAGSRQVIALNERRTFTFLSSAPCTRIDYLSITAETGANLVAGEFIV